MTNYFIKTQCNNLLRALVGENHMDLWWNSRNKAFDLLTPAEIFELDPNKVLNYLLTHASAP